jgi:hypothetical protein
MCFRQHRIASGEKASMRSLTDHDSGPCDARVSGAVELIHVLAVPDLLLARNGADTGY